MTQTRVSEKARNDRDKMKARSDNVLIASDDSFPASDPPSWTGVIGPGESIAAAEPPATTPKHKKKRRS